MNPAAGLLDRVMAQQATRVSELADELAQRRGWPRDTVHGLLLQRKEQGAPLLMVERICQEVAVSPHLRHPSVLLTHIPGPGGRARCGRCCQNFYECFCQACEHGQQRSSQCQTCRNTNTMKEN